MTTTTTATEFPVQVGGPGSEYGLEVTTVVALGGYSSLQAGDKQRLQTAFATACEARLAVKYPLAESSTVTVSDTSERTRRALTWPRQRGRRDLADELTAGMAVRFLSAAASARAYGRTNSTVGRASIAQLAIDAANAVISGLGLQRRLTNLTLANATVAAVGVSTNATPSPSKKADHTVYFASSIFAFVALLSIIAAISIWRQGKEQDRRNNAVLQMQETDEWDEQVSPIRDAEPASHHRIRAANRVSSASLLKPVSFNPFQKTDRDFSSPRRIVLSDPFLVPATAMLRSQSHENRYDTPLSVPRSVDRYA
jgi:hypothetical protein